MPEKPLTVATYAAGASLAAIALVYVFAPTYFLDGEAGTGGRKKGVVGLANPANDCFINSVLQALAGLGELRVYLIRETHRRTIDDGWVYSQPVPPEAQQQEQGVGHAVQPGSSAGSGTRRPPPDWKVEGLQSGIVTKGLKDILDSLNERPIYKKTITATPFVRSLEVAFRQRISRQQQDAQEFLQVVAERLCDEYHAGHRAREYARQRVPQGAESGRILELAENPIVNKKLAVSGMSVVGVSNGSHTAAQPNAPLVQVADGYGTTVEEERKKGAERERPEGADAFRVAGSAAQQATVRDEGFIEQANGKAVLHEEAGGSGREDEKGEGREEEDGFPMEGKVESQIECLTCGFKPRPTASTFCTLTLNVPQSSSTTLNACFDGMFKTEYIDDFKCEKCRLVHAVEVFQAEMQKSTSDVFRARAAEAVQKLQAAIGDDPEKPPVDVILPDVRYAPKRRIARHIRLTRFPKVLAVHLSRSIYDASHLSQKNSAKVAFPERLPLGGLLHQKKYKLLGLVTHKGSHYSGHYESFRRQNIYPPYSNPNTFQQSGVYSKSASPASTPQIGAIQHRSEDSSPLASTPDLLSPSSAFQQRSPTPSSLNDQRQHNSSPSHLPEKDGETASVRSVAASGRTALSRIAGARPSSRSGSRNGQPGAEVLTNKSGGSAIHAASGQAVSPPSPSRPVKKRKQHDRWWRISDEKIKEATTRDVLGMQREVYLLFYEIEKDSI